MGELTRFKFPSGLMTIWCILCTWADCWFKLVSLTHIRLDSNCMKTHPLHREKRKRLGSLWYYSTQSCSSRVKKWFRHYPSLWGKKGLKKQQQKNKSCVLSCYLLFCLPLCSQSAGESCNHTKWYLPVFLLSSWKLHKMTWRSCTTLRCVVRSPCSVGYTGMTDWSSCASVHSG